MRNGCWNSVRHEKKMLEVLSTGGCLMWVPVGYCSGFVVGIRCFGCKTWPCSSYHCGPVFCNVHR